MGFIASNLSVHSSYLPQYINRLIELDFITKEVPITEKNPLKSKLGQYKIKDKFINFCFYYVYKNYNYLEINQTKAVLDEIKTNFNDRFVSFAFEDFTYEQILQNPKKHLGFTPLKLGRWWNNQEKIDLVAMDEQNIAFIECKWQNSVDKTKVLRQLKLKSKCIKHDKNEKFLVFTKEDYLS